MSSYFSLPSLYAYFWLVMLPVALVEISKGRGGGALKAWKIFGIFFTV